MFTVTVTVLEEERRRTEQGHHAAPKQQQWFVLLRSPQLDHEQIILGARLRIQLYLQQVVYTERTEYQGELLFSWSAQMR